LVLGEEEEGEKWMREMKKERQGASEEGKGEKEEGDGDGSGSRDRKNS